MLKNEGKWRRLDNSAKLFSLENESNHNIFRYSVILKQTINKSKLKEALLNTLEKYKSFKVKISNGFFWNYIEYNSKDPIIEKENTIPCESFNLFENNDYLFKITYYQNKINIDMFHVLTDGVGAIDFLKYLIINYLELTKNTIKIENNERIKNNSDEYIKNYNNKIKFKRILNKAFQIKGKILKNKNNTTHYTMNLKKIKEVSTKYKSTITEYVTALYIYSVYLSKYKNSNRDIIIEIPVNLRKYFNVNTTSNFFLIVRINAGINELEKPSFYDILLNVKNEFKEKLVFDKININLTKDVKLGNNIFIRLIPLSLKKLFMKFIKTTAYKTSTSTLSNVGIIDISDEYKKYIDNIYVLVLPHINNKVKCTICSFNNKLNITINSIIKDIEIEKKFYNLIKKDIKNIKIETNRVE